MSNSRPFRRSIQRFYAEKGIRRELGVLSESPGIRPTQKARRDAHRRSFLRANDAARYAATAPMRKEVLMRGINMLARLFGLGHAK